MVWVEERNGLKSSHRVRPEEWQRMAKSVHNAEIPLQISVGEVIQMPDMVSEMNPNTAVSLGQNGGSQVVLLPFPVDDQQNGQFGQVWTLQSLVQNADGPNVAGENVPTSATFVPTVDYLQGYVKDVAHQRAVLGGSAVVEGGGEGSAGRSEEGVWGERMDTAMSEETPNRAPEDARVDGSHSSDPGPFIFGVASDPQDSGDGVRSAASGSPRARTRLVRNVSMDVQQSNDKPTPDDRRRERNRRAQERFRRRQKSKIESLEKQVQELQQKVHSMEVARASLQSELDVLRQTTGIHPRRE